MKILPLIWRNLARDPLRTLLTGAAVAFAVALVCLLRTMPGGLDRLLNEYASNTRISVHNEAGLVYSMPYAYLQKIRSIPGVVAAASWTWFGGVFREEDGVSFPSFAVEPQPLGAVWADYGIDQKQLEDFRHHRDGALVGRGTLLQYGWRIGDLVTLQSTAFPVKLAFRIVGEIPNRQAPFFWFQREYLDQALRTMGGSLDFTGMIWVRVDDPARVGPVMRQIDETFRNSDAQTASETEKSYFSNFFGQLQGFVFIILTVTVLVALCIVFIAANTASMSVRERMPELAVLRAIGFSQRTIFGMLIAEATLLSGIAAVVGAGSSLGLTLVLQHQVGNWNPALGPLGYFVVTRAILVQGLFLGLFVGMVSGFVPSLGASRRSVVDILREVF